MKTAKTTGLAVLSILLILATMSTSASGITGNYQPDSTPFVGVIVLFSDTARQNLLGLSTGILLSPTIMLTAGHSLINAGAVSIFFDESPNTEYKGIDLEVFPEYAQSQIAGGNNGNQVFSSSDIGLIKLDRAVEGVTVPLNILPSAGIVDSLPVNTDLKIIGYGYQYQLTPRNKDAYPWTGIIGRNSAQVNLLSGNFAGSDKYLKCTANQAQGKGGIAFGDSGGPVLYDAGNGQTIILGVNAYVSNSNCAGVTYHTRIDTSQVLEWINGFL